MIATVWANKNVANCRTATTFTKKATNDLSGIQVSYRKEAQVKRRLGNKYLKLKKIQHPLFQSFCSERASGNIKS
jgi:hypothetical protein